VFKGSWAAADVDMAGLQGYASQDETLKRLCVIATALMLRWPESHADITTVSHGPGLGSMHIEEAFTGLEEDGFNDDPAMPNDDVDTLEEIVSGAAHWCYKQLEDNYEYDTGDEAAVEGIEANDYDFDREGERLIVRQCVGGTKCPAGVTA
jgi:hypothetical protein